MINYPDSIRVYDNFLSEENAYKIYATLSSLPQQWFSTQKGFINDNNAPEKSKTWWSIHGDKGNAPELDPQGRMTYNYLATNDHQEGCNCVYCDMTYLFQQNPPPEAQNMSVIDSQLTLFRPGDYLSQHIDAYENRVWAFSYSLSVGWRPEWGGVLNAQDPDDGEWYAFPPVFNRLIMMDVTPGNQNVNHFVSEVIPSCPMNRITFSGWWGHPESPGQLQEDQLNEEVESIVRPMEVFDPQEAFEFQGDFEVKIDGGDPDQATD